MTHKGKCKIKRISLFVILVGAVILGSIGQIYVGGGTFDVPGINEHFDQENPGQ